MGVHETADEKRCYNTNLVSDLAASCELSGGQRIPLLSFRSGLGDDISTSLTLSHLTAHLTARRNRAGISQGARRRSSAVLAPADPLYRRTAPSLRRRHQRGRHHSRIQHNSARREATPTSRLSHWQDRPIDLLRPALSRGLAQLAATKRSDPDLPFGFHTTNWCSTLG